MTDTTRTIVKSFKSFFLGTSFSRISGLFRDVSMAFFFGSSPFIAIFMVAYRFANLFRRLFGESSLSSSFIPHYESLRAQNFEKSSKFYRDLFFTMLFLLVPLIVFSEIFLFSISKYFINTQIITLTSIMLPSLLFICLYALNSAFLQCHKNYFVSSIAPAFFNIIWILTVLTFKNFEPSKFVYILSFAVVVAFLFQFLTTTIPSCTILLNDLSIKNFFKPHPFSKEIKKLTKPILLSILGIGAVQINSALDSLFAIYADKSGPAYLWYAIRLYQLPIALFGIAIASAILPPLTRAYRQDNFDNFKTFFNLAIKKSFFFMSFCCFGIFCLAPSAINLIYGRGAFGLTSFLNTTYCLFGYAIGLIFASFVMIIASSFYAKKEYFIPTLAAILSVVLNILLNSIFIFYFNLKSSSVAISTSISSALNFFVLLYFLNKKYKNIFEKDVLKSVLTAAFSAAFAFALTIIFGYYLKDQSILFLLNKSFILENSFIKMFLSFFSLFSIYLLSFVGCSYILRSKELFLLLKKDVNM